MEAGCWRIGLSGKARKTALSPKWPGSRRTCQTGRTCSISRSRPSCSMQRRRVHCSWKSSKMPPDLQNLDQARMLDQDDPLAGCRDLFYLPPAPSGRPFAYFCGNSLGLQPKAAREAVLEELDD